MTNGTYNFVYVTLNVAPFGESILAVGGFVTKIESLVALLVITQFSEQVKIRFISQLINGISSVLEKLLKYFNGTAISTSFSVLLPSNPPVIMVLKSKDFKS